MKTTTQQSRSFQRDTLADPMISESLFLPKNSTLYIQKTITVSHTDHTRIAQETDDKEDRVTNTDGGLTTTANNTTLDALQVLGEDQLSDTSAPRISYSCIS